VLGVVRPNTRRPRATPNHRNASPLGDIEEFGRTTPSTATQRKRGPNDTTVLLNASEFADSELQDSEIQEMQEMQHSMAMHSQSKENRMADSNLAVAAPAPRAQAVTVSVRYEEHFALWLRQSKALWAQQQLTKRRYRKKKRARTANVDDSDSDDGGASGRDSKRRKVAGHGADGYFRLQQRLDELYSNCWQIVQVVALEHPGKFALWIYVNGRLRRVRMVVPRPFFVNVHRLESFPKLQRSGKLVAMKLPRNRPLLNLLRIELKEHDFVEQAKQIGMFLTHPDIEGVYETNVPLLFRAISAIGCCAAVSPLTKMQNAHSTMGFALDDLEFRSTAQQQYLAHSKFDMIRHPGNDDGGEGRVSRESIKYMFFYHSTANNANTNNDVRSVFAFVYQRKHQRLHEYHCRIIAVNKHKKHRLELPDLQHRARELIAHFDLDHHRDVVLLVKESEVKSIGRAYAEANKFLDEYNLLLNGPTILMAQTAATPHDIHSKMPVIHDHFPMVPLLFNKMDNRYPPLQWFRFATLKMIEGWIVVPNLLEQKKGFARYSHIPIGNMPHDVWSYTSDVFFSRLLADHKHLWWISDGSRPDLGGLEEDENLFDDEHSNPVMNNRGAFHTFCIELRLNHLATNTVLQSEHIQTIELGLGGDAGAGDMALTDKKMDGERKENFVKSNIRIDDTSACLASFKILKKLISNWMQDVGASSYNEYADRLLMEFYRWLRTPSSLFYDPLLHRMVHRLMKKVLMQLVAQLKRFGAVVIYASFDRIVIETKKRQFGDAVAYIDSCLSSIGKQDLFEWLTVTPSHFWECLLWHDHANFAGFIFTEKERPSDAVLAPEDALKMEHYQRELELRWNIASFLPSYAEDLFDVVVAGYLTAVRKEYRRLLGLEAPDDDDDADIFAQQPLQKKAVAAAAHRKEDRLKKKRVASKAEVDGSDDDDIDIDALSDDDLDFLNDDDDGGDGQQSKGMAVDDGDDGTRSEGGKEEREDLLASEVALRFAEFKRNLVSDRIALTVFQFVRQIKAKLPRDTSQGANAAAAVFPVRRGSHLPLQDPALEFVKYLCLVLELDSDLTEQTAILRKNLMRMVEVGGFSAASKFVDPCSTFVLPDVNCFQCKQSKDLDLCRDEFTTPLCLQSEHQRRAQQHDDEWDVRCVGCGALYDRHLVEAMLLDVVRRRETAYHVQDVLCAHCGRAKVDDMAEHCHCSGPFRNKENREHFEQSMDVFYSIARCYGFHFLADAVEWITRDSVAMANH